MLFAESDRVYSGSGKVAGVDTQPPLLIVSPHQTGPLRIVEHSTKGPSFLLRSSRGWLYSLQWESNLNAPTLYELGRKLDPAQLPKLPRQGVAVAMTYAKGNRMHRTVVLVGLATGYGQTYSGRTYGYLDGYTLPKPSSENTLLRRQLLGPDGRLYRIDNAGHRLARVTAPAATGHAWDPFDVVPRSRCAAWPAGSVTYRA